MTVVEQAAALAPLAEAGDRVARRLSDLMGSRTADAVASEARNADRAAGSAASGGALRMHGGRLLSATVAAPETDAVALFAAARAAGLVPVLWIQPRDGFALVAIGEEWATEPVGPDRFAAADAAWAHLARGARVSDDSGPARGTGPLLVGGFAFDPAGGDDATWAGFGPGRLVLPSLLWTRTAGGTWLTANLVERTAGDVRIDPGREMGAPADDARTDPGSASGALADDARTDPGRVSGAPPDDATARAHDLARTWAAVAVDVDGPVEGVRGRLRTLGGPPPEEVWRAIVGRYAGAVGRGRVDKVVLARRVDLEGQAAIDVAGALARLVKVAPESTIFAAARGDAVFLGATPERLVRTEGREARTVAIAGTARRGASAAEDDALAADLLADEKEREEHAVVVRMLRDSLRPLCESLEIAPAPRVIRLRTVQHLCTDVTARTTDRSGILALVGVLHPTPAVGGQPREAALALIRDQEPIDRGWYAGPLGWLDRDGDGEFVVALRSGVVRGDRASLFAGCGIVADSDPTREWEESRIKLRALGGALGSADL